MSINLEHLNKNLISSIENDSMGISYGKMGYCIYLFEVSRITNNKLFEYEAIKIINEIVSKTSDIKSISFQNGAIGIGIGIDYLVKNEFVTGNINNLLNSIDNLMFKQLSYSEIYNSIDFTTLIHALYYLDIRYKSQKNGSESWMLTKDLIIHVINILYEKISNEHFETPLAFSIDYVLPQLLYIIGKLFNLNVYNNKLTIMINELTPYIASTLPLLNSCKLYLLWGISSVCKQVQMQGLNYYKDLLIRETNVNIIINSEVNDNIYFYDGLTAIYYLLYTLKTNFSITDYESYQKLIIHKIQSSHLWEPLLKDSRYFNNNKGLWGFCGASLLLYRYQNI